MVEIACTRRLLAWLVGLAAALLCIPASAAGYGTVVPEDTAGHTSEYDFGWSAARQLDGNLEPIPPTLQYFKGKDTPAYPGEGCPIEGSPAGGPPSDGADEPVRAFKFFNDPPLSEPRVQVTTPSGFHNRRMIGTDRPDLEPEVPALHDVRREYRISDHPFMGPEEKRGCGVATTGVRDPVPDMTFYGEHHWNTLTPEITKAACAENFDDNEWIASPYYEPTAGKVYALMHQESRVKAQPSGTLCPAEAPGDLDECTWAAQEAGCWLASITFAESSGVENCRTGRTHSPNNGFELPLGSNTTPNSLGACYQHNHTLTNEYDFPPPLAELPQHVVATIPYEYYTDWGCADTLPQTNGVPFDAEGNICGRHGYKELSNVIKGASGEASGDMGNNYFVLVQVSAPLYDEFEQVRQPPRQKRGVCLLRTTDLADPESWRAWGGNDFNVQPQDGYTLGSGDPSAHFCEPVSITGPIPWSLTYNRYLKKYMMLGSSSALNSAGESKPAVTYQLSTDLRNWSEPQAMAFAPSRNKSEAECLDGVTYPVVLDPADPAAAWSGGSSGNPNFDHPGSTPDLYYTHEDVIAGSPCTVGPTGFGAGNIARLPIDFRNQRQATFEDGIQDVTWGFNGVSPGIIYTTSGGAEGSGYGERDLTNAASQQYVKASLYNQMSTSPHGFVNTGWENKDEVWYGAAFFLPSNFQTTHADLDVLRWDSSSDYGGIGLRTLDDKFHLLRNGNWIGNGFDLPTGRWTWVEVHQRFGQSGDAPQSDVFVDGKLVLSSTDANRSATTTITKLGVGFVNEDPTYNPIVSVAFDRVSILGGQRGAYQGPDTPTGLTAVRAGANVDLDANVVSPAPTGYRFYRRPASGGAWTLVGSNTTPDVTDSGVACATAYEYRVTSYKQLSGVDTESIVSSPVTVAASC